MASNISTLVSRGGKAGILSDKTRKQRDAALRIIKETWSVNSLEDVFPQAIKPVAEMGTTAIANMKTISNRVSELSEVRALFLEVCKDSDGNPVPVSFTHTGAVLDILKKRAEPVATTPSASTPTPRAISRVSGRAPTDKGSDTNGKKKENAKAANSSIIPDGLIIPSASIAPPFSYSGNAASSPKKGEVATQKDKDTGTLKDPLLDKGSSALLAGAANPSLPAMLNEAAGHIFPSFNKRSSELSALNVPKKRSIVADDLERLKASKKQKNEQEKELETDTNGDTKNSGNPPKYKQTEKPEKKKKTLAQELFPSSEDEAPTTPPSKLLDQAAKADDSSFQVQSDLPITLDDSAAQRPSDVSNVSDGVNNPLVQQAEDPRSELEKAMAELAAKSRSFFDSTPPKSNNIPPMPDTSEYDAENTIVVDASSPQLPPPAPPRSPSPSKRSHASRRSLSVSGSNYVPPKRKERPSRREKTSPPTAPKTSSKSPKLQAPVAQMHDLPNGVDSLKDAVLQLPGKLRSLLDDELTQKLTRQHPQALLDLRNAVDTAARHLQADIEHVFQKEEERHEDY